MPQILRKKDHRICLFLYVLLYLITPVSLHFHTGTICHIHAKKTPKKSISLLTSLQLN